MAKETSWFVGFTKRPSPDATPNTTSNSTPLREQVAGSEVDRLANQLSAGATIKGPDPEEERDPPPRPVPLVFPKTFPKVTVRWSSDHPPPNFQQLFASIQRPEAILTWHLRALNCRQLTGRSRDALLPWKPDGTSYFPTTADMMFAERIAELNITNDAAFRSLSKTTKLGDRAPRLAWTRKFWLALHNMSEYWCVDGEEYYDIQVPVKLGSEQPTKTVQRYKGRRTANGHDMPDSYRADTGKAFVESVTGAFLCRVEAPYFPSGPKRFAPSLQVGNLEQPVRLTAVVMRLPTDRDRYRAGFKEGPVMGVLERNTTHFGGARGLDVSWRKSEYDLLREIGAMLLIAQQRAHEGQAAPTRSEGEWYTTKPRWGGGSGSKLPALQQSEDDYKEILNRLDALERLEGGPPAKEVSILEAEMKVVRERHKRAQIQEQALKDMRPPPSLWHDKTDYKAIGKPRKAPYDEIFLVSFLYHHVSILKMTVHEAYLSYLTTGKMPEQTPAQIDWSSPRLERTEWYDLFDRKDRVEAFSCIWGVMEYVNRDVPKSGSGAVSAGNRAGDKPKEKQTGGSEAVSTGGRAQEKPEKEQRGGSEAVSTGNHREYKPGREQTSKSGAVSTGDRAQEKPEQQQTGGGEQTEGGTHTTLCA